MSAVVLRLPSRSRTPRLDRLHRELERQPDPPRAKPLRWAGPSGNANLHRMIADDFVEAHRRGK